MPGSSDRSRQLTIGQLSGKTGASRRSLRHYEDEGLLSAARGPNGYRAYTEDAVEVVGRIKALLSLGLPLRVVREVLPCVHSGDLRAVSPCTGLRDVLTDELRRLDAVASKVLATRAAIDAVLQRAAASTAPSLAD